LQQRKNKPKEEYKLKRSNSENIVIEMTSIKKNLNMTPEKTEKPSHKENYSISYTNNPNVKNQIGNMPELQLFQQNPNENNENHINQENKDIRIKLKKRHTLSIETTEEIENNKQKEKIRRMNTLDDITNIEFISKKIKEEINRQNFFDVKVKYTIDESKKNTLNLININ